MQENKQLKVTSRWQRHHYACGSDDFWLLVLNTWPGQTFFAHMLWLVRRYEGAWFIKNRGNCLFFPLAERLNSKWKLWGTAGRASEGLQTLAHRIVEGIRYTDVQIGNLQMEEIVWAEGVYRRRAGVARDSPLDLAGIELLNTWSELRFDDAFGFHCLLSC